MKKNWNIRESIGMQANIAENVLSLIYRYHLKKWIN